MYMFVSPPSDSQTISLHKNAERGSPPENSAPHDIMQHGLDLLVAMELLDVDSLGHLVTTDDRLLGVSLT